MFEFKIGYNRDITDTIRTCGYDGEKTDTIRPKVLTPVHFQMFFNGDIIVLYHVTFFGGHSLDHDANSILVAGVFSFLRTQFEVKKRTLKR